MNAFQQEKTRCRRAIQRAIGEQLRAIYEPQLNEPLPLPLSELVNELSRGDNENLSPANCTSYPSWRAVDAVTPAEQPNCRND
jgi:hypothetical protein